MKSRWPYCRLGVFRAFQAGILRVFLVMVVLSVATVAHADRPTGVTSQTLSLPSGPSSLKGLGESFEPNIATGTGSYSVPVALPPGFVAPQVSLNYTGGQGKGVLGPGWSLPTLEIYRQTDKGSPDFDEDDRFAVRGPGLNDELVRVNEKKGYYRLKNEGAHALFVRDEASNSWEVRLPSGQTAYFGTKLESRETSRGRAYRWFVDRQEDRFGHWTEYRYFTDTGKTYLSEIEYQMHAKEAFRNRVAFDYENRPDVFTDYTYGAGCMTALRLSQLTVFHGARQLRTYRLSYREGLRFSLLERVEMEGEGGLSLPPLSFEYLEEGTEAGGLITPKNLPPLEPLLDGSGELDDVNSDGLPDLIVARHGDYHYYENFDGRRFEPRRSLKNSPDRDLYEEGVVFVDVNGDGHRDLLHPQGDGFRYYPGGDIEKGVFRGYGKPVDLGSTSDGFVFTDANLKMGDQNSDGRIDLLWQKPGQDGWLVNGEDDVIREEYVRELPVDIDFGDPRVEMTDFNGDGVLDFVRKEFGFDKSNVRVWFGLGHGEFLTEQQVINVPRGDPKEFHLRDVNRDGQADLVRVSGSWATVYLNRGNLRFSGKRGDYYGLPSTSQTQKLLFSDMNGNGTTDLVWVTTDFKLRYLDLSSEPNAGLLSRIDNGMGLVARISYTSSTAFAVEAKDRGRPWVHPLPTPVPVISEIQTTDSLDLIGLPATVTVTSYDYRDGYYDGKEREFRGFAEASVTSWGDSFHETLVTQSKMHVGRNPVTLEDEEVLKGKPFFEVQMNEEGEIFSSVETLWERRYLCQEDLPGGAPQILPKCDQLGDLEDKKDQLVQIGLSTDALTAIYERTAVPRFTAAHSVFDAWGNSVESVNYGEVAYSGVYTPGAGFDPGKMKVGVGGDEQVVKTTLIYDTSQWLIGLTSKTELLDLLGNSYGQTKTFYDGLSWGSVQNGLVSRVSKLFADEDRWIDQDKFEYDTHGQRVATVNAVGDRVELQYESETHLFPSAEKIIVGDEDAPVRQVTFLAETDRAYGLITSSVDPNGHVWRTVLDGLGRAVESYDPLGDLPAVKYSYEFGSSEYPVSVTRVDELVERSGRYHSIWAYSDGAGRPRQEKETSDKPQSFVASAWTQLSSRGSPTRVFEPFFSTTLGLQQAPSVTPVTSTRYDAMGRAIEVGRPATDDLPGGSVSYTSFSPLKTISYTERESSLGQFSHPTITHFDGLGRKKEIEKLNSSGGELQRLNWKISYDTRGSITAFADSHWNGEPDDVRHLRRYVYDSLGRLTTIEDPNAGRTDFLFDDIGRMVHRTDALGQVQEWTYGRGGRLLERAVRGSVQGVADYSYRYHYDEVAGDSPLKSEADSNLIGKLSWLEFSTGEEHFSYDALGRLQERAQRLWNPGVSSEQDQTRDTFRRRVTYRADGKAIESSLDGGLRLTFSYNERKGVQSLSGSIGDQQRQILKSANYDQRGFITRNEFGNGVGTCSRYNERAELIEFVAGEANGLDCGPQGAGKPGGVHHLQYTYGYDGLLGSIKDLSDPVSGKDRLDATFEYDAIQQLVGVSDSRATVSFSYDEVQNLVRREIQGEVQGRITGDFGYGESLSNGRSAGPNAITTADGETYEYDAAGQMLRYNGYDLRFDPEGRLIEASNVAKSVRVVQHFDDSGELRIALVYRGGAAAEVHRYVSADYHIRDGEEIWFAGGGGAGVEVLKSKGLKVDAYLLDQLTAYVNGTSSIKPVPEEYADLNGDGNRLDEDDLAVALAAFQSGDRVGGEKFVWKYVTSDHLGSATHVTDSAGDLVGHTRFHAYGAVASRYGQRAWRGAYIGKDLEALQDLGLQRIGARYYAPKLGRWVSPDPLIGGDPALMVARPLESNLYSYASNNPIMGKDPSGLQTTKTNAVVAVLSGGNDSHSRDLDTFLRRNYGSGKPKSFNNGGTQETRQSIGASGSDGNSIIEDIGRAADALKGSKATGRRTIELALHAGPSAVARNIRKEGDTTFLEGGFSNTHLSQVLAYRSDRQRLFAKRMAKAKASKDAAEIAQVEQDMADYDAANSERAAMSQVFEEAAEKLAAAKVDQVNLQACNAGADTRGVARLGSMGTNLARLLSTKDHKVEIGTHRETINTHGSKEVSLGESESQKSSTSLPTPGTIDR